MGKPPKVGIVLLNWNNYSDTADCLLSLDQISYENYFVVVVDNGSSDGSAEQLSTEFDWCDFVFNDENLGFSGGCNVGIDHAMSNGADYVLLLNNDIEVSSDFLEPLVSTAEKNNRVAAVGGIIFDGHSDEIWDAGGEMQPFFANHRKYTSKQSSKAYRTEFVTCAMNLLSEEFLKDHRLDEEFFFGVEEIDLSWRATDDDWKLFINPNSKVYHEVGSATDHMFSGESLFSPFQKYHNTRGRLYHSRKNLRLYHTVFFYMAVIFIYPFIYIGMGAIYDRFDILRAHLLSIYDYFIGSEVRQPQYFEEY